MKKFIILATAFLFTLNALAQTKFDDVLKVDVETYNFGKIKQGEPVTCNFILKNISKAPISIESTVGSCGCTTPEKIEKPIMPGKSVPLKVQFSAAGAGTFTKDVTIKLSGIDQTKVIYITGEVLGTDAYNAWKAGAGKN